MRFGTDTPHSDKLDDESDATTRRRSDSTPTRCLYAPRGLTATTQGLDDSMACGRSEGATIRAEFLDTEVSASARGLDDAMDECYDDEMSEKATMQIGR